EPLVVGMDNGGAGLGERASVLPKQRVVPDDLPVCDGDRGDNLAVPVPRKQLLRHVEELGAVGVCVVAVHELADSFLVAWLEPADDDAPGRGSPLVVVVLGEEGSGGGDGGVVHAVLDE